MKDKKGVSIVNEFYNNSFKKWLQDNDIAMYSSHNEGKSVVAERFISTIKNKIYEYMTSISKNVYIDKLDDTVKKCNNTYHRTIKIKSIDVKDNKYINIGKEVNDNDLKFKLGDYVRISKYKKKFTKGYIPNWSEKIFVIKEIKNTVPWNYVIKDLNGEEVIGTFYDKELQKIDQQEFRIEKVIKKKGNKLYVKWKGYDSSFKSWIDKKDLVSMGQYFPKQYEPFGGEINVKVGLSNYATKTDLKNVSHVDVSSFALKSNLASLKTAVDKLDIDKLAPVPNDLAKLSTVVKIMLPKRLYMTS